MQSYSTVPARPHVSSSDWLSQHPITHWFDCRLSLSRTTRGVVISSTSSSTSPLFILTSFAFCSFALVLIRFYSGNRSFLAWYLESKRKKAAMAIYSSVPPPAQQVQVEAWTVSALQSLNISPSARGTGVTLSIPLDSDSAGATGSNSKAAYSSKSRTAAKEPLRRDSQRRREALLKGKEGSRRR